MVLIYPTSSVLRPLSLVVYLYVTALAHVLFTLPTMRESEVRLTFITSRVNIEIPKI